MWKAHKSLEEFAFYVIFILCVGIGANNAINKSVKAIIYAVKDIVLYAENDFQQSGI